MDISLILIHELCLDQADQVAVTMGPWDSYDILYLIYSLSCYCSRLIVEF